MSADDISRHLFDPRMRYATALMQQGRVLTDADWNEMVMLEDEDRRQIMAETVCTEGSPNDGFLVVGLTQPVPVTMFPENPPPATNVVNTYDLTLGTGSFYLGGYRFTIEQTPAETSQSQRDWLTRTIGTGVLPMATDLTAVPTVPAAARTDIVCLMGYEQTVTSIEDQEFRERALGGPDTTVRVRRMRKIAVLQNATSTTCSGARAELHSHLTAPRAGDTSGVSHSFDATGTELLSKARLTVTFSNTGTDNDPCKPRQVRGFIGAENQAIRVQCTAANQFIWGFDNTAPLYRVQVDASDPTNHRLVFLTTPRDRAALPLQGQAVEILPWDAFLANGEKAAALTGFVSSVATSYEPEHDTLALTSAVPQNMITWLADAASTPFENPLDPVGQRRFFYLRVWTGGPPQPFTPGTAVPLTDTGLEVTFSDFAIPGDYWIIAARPNTPDLVVPWRLLDEAPPTGPRLFFTALAMVRWTISAGVATAAIQDCRERFRSLCRSNGCCRYIVGDGQESHGDFTSINAAIDALPQPEGGEVCVLDGRYVEAVDLSNKTNIRVHGCGRDTVIVAPAGATAAVTIGNAHRIGVHKLVIEAPAALGIAVLDDLSDIVLRELWIAARDRSAILAKVNDHLIVEHCELTAGPLAADLAPGGTIGLEPLLYAAGDRIRIEMNRIAVDNSGTSSRRASGGLQIGGGSSHVEIRRNEIDVGNGDAIILGSIHFDTLPNASNPNSQVPGGNSGGATISTPGFVFDPNDCVLVPGDPQDPTGPGGEPLFPVSEGDLVDIAIIDNRITRMGRNGITVPRLYFPEEAPDLINIQQLLIAENVIRECMRLEVGPISPANIRRVAFGGIVLAGVELATIRDNVIEEVGIEHRDQICGIFVRYAIGIAIDDNRIRRNGQVAVEGQPLKLGFRGGIHIVFARAPVEPVSFAVIGAELSGQRQDGMPAASIHDNVVVAREGRALHLVALGPVTITNNQFTAHGSDFLALLTFLISVFLGIQLATGATTGAAQLPADESLADVLLDALGGNAILVFNLGFSNEIYFQMLGLADPVPVPGQAANDDTRWFVGGNIQFNDNQVVFDTLNPVFTLSLCAVLLLTFDDVVMNGNQIDCDMAFDFVIVDTLIASMSANVTGNRFKEGALNAYLSALTVGFLMNATALNVGTHCIVHWGILEPRAIAGTAAPDVRLNVALTDPNGDSHDCNVFSRADHDPAGAWGNGAYDVGYVPVQAFGG